MKRQSLGVLIILLSALAIYAPSGAYDVNLDDNYIIDNLPPPESGLKGAFSVFTKRFDYVDYRPVSTFTVALEQYVTGSFNIHISHLVNALLFCIAALIAFKVLMRLPVDDIYPKALLITLLFICHPIHSNVVCSLKNRDIILSFLFGMMSLYFFIRFLSKNKPRAAFLILAILFFNIATFCKRDAFSFALIFPVVYFIFFPGNNRIRTFLWAVAILGISLAESQIIFRWIQGFAPITETNIGSAVLYTENPLVEYHTLLNSIGAALTSFMYYLKFHIIPAGYHFYFGFDMINLDFPLNVLNLFSLIIMAGGLVLIYIFRESNRLLVFGCLFFFMGLVYALNLRAPVAGIVAPRLAFLASYGFCIALIMLILELTRLFADKKENAFRNLVMLCIPLYLIMVLFTLHRNKAWQNLDTLLEADMPKLTRSFQAQRIAMAHYSRIAQQEEDQELREVILQKGLDHALLAHNLFDGHIFVEEGIGVLQYFLGYREEAKQQLKKVTEEFNDAQKGFEILGDIYFYDGNFDEAVKHFKKHIERAPLYDASYYKLTNSMVWNGQVEESVEYNTELISKYPDDFIGYDNLGYTYLLSGDTLQSSVYFVEALKRGLPDDAVMFVIQDYYRRNNLEVEWHYLIRDVVPAP